MGVLVSEVCGRSISNSKKTIIYRIQKMHVQEEKQETMSEVDHISKSLEMQEQ